MRCSNACRECSWMVAHTHAITVMRGLIFHHVASSACVRGLHLLDFSLAVVVVGNQSWQYVNSMSWMMWGVVGVIGG